MAQQAAYAGTGRRKNSVARDKSLKHWTLIN